MDNGTVKAHSTWRAPHMCAYVSQRTLFTTAWARELYNNNSNCGQLVKMNTDASICETRKSNFFVIKYSVEHKSIELKISKLILTPKVWVLKPKLINMKTLLLFIIMNINNLWIKFFNQCATNRKLWTLIIATHMLFIIHKAETRHGGPWTCLGRKELIFLFAP